MHGIKNKDQSRLIICICLSGFKTVTFELFGLKLVYLTAVPGLTAAAAPAILAVLLAAALNAAVAIVSADCRPWTINQSIILNQY